MAPLVQLDPKEKWVLLEKLVLKDQLGRSVPLEQKANLAPLEKPDQLVPLARLAHRHLKPLIRLRPTQLLHPVHQATTEKPQRTLGLVGRYPRLS